MTKQRISFIVETDGDPSTILDVAHELGAELQDQLESYGYEATVDEDETCVEDIEETMDLQPEQTHLL